MPLCVSGKGCSATLSVEKTQTILVQFKVWQLAEGRMGSRTCSQTLLRPYAESCITIGPRGMHTKISHILYISNERNVSIYMYALSSSLTLIYAYLHIIFTVNFSDFQRPECQLFKLKMNPLVGTGIPAM